MSAWWNETGLSGLMTPEQFMNLLRAVLILIAGLVVARLAGSVAGRAAGARFGKQESMVARRLVFYGLIGLTLAATLNQLGFNLGVLLGAAGILTVAIGFASQTSASNLISGLFLIAERSFVVGDVITIEEQTGEVLSIDLLSVKLRTFDNLMVRVPNESIIKTRVTNLKRFPLRRADLQIGVAYKEDLTRVHDILLRVAEANPLCLDEPETVFIFKGYGDSALEMQFSVWGVRENFLNLRNSMYLEIKAAFDEAGIEIPFPHRTIYTGEVTKPFPVRVVTSQTDMK